MKIIKFLFGKCGDTILAKSVYILMIVFVLATGSLSIFNTDFTDFLDILWNLFFIFLIIGVSRGLYWKFRKEQERNYEYVPCADISKTGGMRIIEIIFGKCGNTRFSKITYVLMIVYLIVSLFILNLKYTNFANFSDIIFMIIGTIVNVIWARVIYKKFFCKYYNSNEKK